MLFGDGHAQGFDSQRNPRVIHILGRAVGPEV